MTEFVALKYLTYLELHFPGNISVRELRENFFKVWSNSHTCSNNAREREEYFWVCTEVCKIVIPVYYNPFCTLQFCLSKSTIAAAYFHLYAADSDKIIILKYVSKTEEWIWECDWTNSYSVECHVHIVSLKTWRFLQKFLHVACILFCFIIFGWLGISYCF